MRCGGQTLVVVGGENVVEVVEVVGVYREYGGGYGAMI